VSRAQGDVTDLAKGDPDYEEHTKHLSPELLAANTSWCLWQKKVYLDVLGPVPGVDVMAKRPQGLLNVGTLSARMAVLRSCALDI
jgi:hypothetical protein